MPSSDVVRAAPAVSLRYGPWAIAAHWILFVLLVVVGTLGLLHDSWPKHSQAFWINIHALLGLSLWTLLMLRFLGRLQNPPPPPPADLSRAMRRLARAVHLTLYALLFVIPIFGIVTFIWHGRSLDLGITQINFGVAKNRAIFEPTEDIHGYLAYAVFALAAAHAVAALWHHFVNRNAVLGRMWRAPHR
ncbi:MAG: cytochrome b [Steroidobacteraceae bacterium]